MNQNYQIDTGLLAWAIEPTTKQLLYGEPHDTLLQSIREYLYQQNFDSEIYVDYVPSNTNFRVRRRPHCLNVSLELEYKLDCAMDDVVHETIRNKGWNNVL